MTGVVGDVDDVEGLVDDREVDLTSGEHWPSTGEHRMKEPLVAKDKTGVAKDPLQRSALRELREAGAICFVHGDEPPASGVLQLMFEKVRKLVGKQEPWTLLCGQRIGRTGALSAEPPRAAFGSDQP